MSLIYKSNSQDIFFGNYKKPETLIKLEEFQTNKNVRWEHLGFYISYDHHYSMTPIDVIPFAGTGGDGIHFGFLTDFGNVTDLNNAPVVAVHPGDDPPVRLGAILIFASLIVFLYLAYANQWGNNPLSFVPFLALASLFVIICSMFYKLTVELSGSKLQLIYGIGLIRIKYRIDELERIEIIKTPWYYGLGIRITPKGMLYNIHGSKAVNIEYTSKGRRKSFMVGTPEPEQLKKALEDNWKK